MNNSIIICKATPMCLTMAGFDFTNATKEQAEETIKFYENCLYHETHSKRVPFAEARGFQMKREDSIADYQERINQ